ncbi:N-acetyltransferase [Aestuariibacter sp. GS-14]|uniref:GNAT family N-acetyltransferase n=1 Tax=Aestuariibacter sp. GS-14 TaxID=2590670 RepID=UPI001128DB19|nr:GNAT family N-acetyltransferase [Aestuariibacter sp. GS-14]TPV61893.1 N-acetyltransferase [Aestuariibacter sp. GS-14]
MAYEVNIQGYRLCCLDAISAVSQTEWDRLARYATTGGPFVQYSWLALLEDTGCVGQDTGWQPAHWVIYEGNSLVAAIPGYIKTHSYGEYVFDHSWANAYHQHGFAYYPKWIAAIPFTPVTGPRILLDANADFTRCLQALSSALQSWANQQGISSLHWLFHNHSRDAFEGIGFPTRRSVQFEWVNRKYSQFDDFLNVLTSRKRRDIRKTRSRVLSGGMQIHTLTGDQLTTAHMTTFIACYQDTYLKRSGHKGYLTPDFFFGLLTCMPDNICLVLASRSDKPIAAALFLYDKTGLYGRYWGCLEDIDSLHFECCYFRGIDFAIAQNLPVFNPGTQGEHKILRGFEPKFCYSQHQLLHPDFHSAVEKFLHQEMPAIQQYFNQAQDVLPFNSDYINTFVNTNDKPSDSDHT